ncbi:la-related protein 6b [Pungitius pungitius]|uniref:la-related protein 6b n=1 Tax=Pungitius pungitius TaxID=134920 RepID=UPI002E1056FB
MKIKAKLEDLLSDSHLAEDGFLLKHVQRDKQGHVSLKLLTSLKKIKALTTNWYMTLAAAEASDLLAVNEERTKVRRIEPLPRWLLCSPTSKVLLAWNICVRKTTEEDVAPWGQEQARLSQSVLQKFSPHGSVTSLWVLYPGCKLPKELQCYAKRHKVLGQHLCAVVKFDHLDEVRKAYKALKAEEIRSNGEGMSVVPLGFQAMHRVTSDQSSDENNEDKPQDTPSQDNPLDASEDMAQEDPAREDLAQEDPAQEDPAQEDPTREEASAPPKVSDTCPPQKSMNNSTLISTSCTGRQSFPGWNQRFNKRSCWSGDCSNGNSQSPWVQSRKVAASALNPGAAESRDAPAASQRVLRQPRGPDGTKGFHNRGVAAAPSNSPRGKHLPLCPK